MSAAFALGIELLLLVESSDYLLQTRLHVARYVPSLLQVFHDRGGEKADCRRIGTGGGAQEQGTTGDEQGNAGDVNGALRVRPVYDSAGTLQGVSHDAFLAMGVQGKLP